MEMRTLGKSQIRIAPLMFGGNVFGWTANASATNLAQLEDLIAGARLKLDLEAIALLNAVSGSGVV